jgi:N-acetylglucosaminyldiphosphoundecaprenol N-acetyl-beta-D-mannosaminyltransferase
VTARYAVCEVAVDGVGPEAATAWILERCATRRGGAVHLANAWSLALARQDVEHRASLADGDLVVPDGMPLVWIARRLGLDVPDRVYGPDLLDRTMDRGRSVGLRHHLYGASPDVVEEAADVLTRRHPGAQIAAADSPPFGPVTCASSQAAISRVDEVGADVVWVALGTPRQDALMHQIRPAVQQVLVGVGAAFDFVAGAQPQAPPVLQRAGLEWAFRLLSQPRRLGRRYLVGNAVFLRALAASPPHLLPDQSSTSP